MAFASGFYNSQAGPSGWGQGDLKGSKKGDGILAAAERSGSECKCITDTSSSIEMQPKYAIGTKFFRIRFI